MATPEAKVKAWMYKRLSEELPDLYVYKPPGGMYGNSGAPDGMCIWQGVFFAIEVKRDRTNSPTKLQLLHLEHIKRQRCIVAVMYGKDEDRLQAIVQAVKQRALIIDQGIKSCQS